MTLEIEANIIIMINHKFEINVKVEQDFFPLFFGYEEYNCDGIVDLIDCLTIDID